MRTHSTRLLFAAVAMLLILPTLPSASAADLSVRTARHHHHHRSIVVADYDGTPIYLRHSRRIVRDYYGMEQVADVTDAYPVLNIANPTTYIVPTRYLNGQPIR